MKELRNFCRKARLAQDYIIFASRRSIEPEDLFRVILVGHLRETWKAPITGR